mgnify:CR=1 FL=1
MRPTPALPRLLTLCLCALLVGCASVSLEPAPPPAQVNTPRLLPAWDVLATELAERIVNRLSDLPAPADTATEAQAEQTPAKPPVTLALLPFTVQTHSASDFDKAMATLLTQRLLAMGMLLDAGEHSGQIEVGVQLIERVAQPPWLLLSTQVRSSGRLQMGTADLYAIEPGDLPLFIAPVPIPPAEVKQWRMVTP